MLAAPLAGCGDSGPVRRRGGYSTVSALAGETAEALVDCPTNEHGEVAAFDAGDEVTVTQ